MPQFRTIFIFISFVTSVNELRQVAGFNLCAIKFMVKVAVFHLLETFKWDVGRELNNIHINFTMCVHI